MTYMTAHSSAERTSTGSPASASQPSTDGLAVANSHQPSKATSGESRGLTSTDSSLQRDANWLRTATVEEIDSALDHGELNRLLGVEPMT
jgi:hypothetical protein